MGHNGNTNSLKNLERGRWLPGQSGNPTGRAKGVVYPSELLHGLLAMDDDGTPKYTRSDLEKIVEDENSAPALVIAAQWILDGMRDGQRWIMGKDGELKPAALDPTPARVPVDQVRWTPGSLHDFRDTFLTANKHLPIDVLKRIAGHSTLETTLKYYVSERPEDAAAVRAAVDAAGLANHRIAAG